MKYPLLVLLPALAMQSRVCSSCFAFATKTVHPRAFSTLPSLQLKIPQSLSVRGGFEDVLKKEFVLPRSIMRAASTNSIGQEGSASSIQKSAAEASLGIADQSTEKDFGGLKYHESKEGVYRVVFVLGGPGAGKGTQSDLLLQNYPCVHLSAGELLRGEMEKEGSPHAALISECLVGGRIVPVEISLSLLQNAMEEAAGRSLVFLVDGFPRNFDNLQGWTKGMTSVANILGVLVFQCPLNVLEERILKRAKESGRSDDNLESLRKRFKTFEGDTIPVIDTLRLVDDSTHMKVVDIQGNQPLENVWKDTQEAMNQFITTDVLEANAKLLSAASTADIQNYTALCADEMLTGQPPSDILKVYEGENPTAAISNAKIEFQTGTKATVSYDRNFGGVPVRETRVWSHQGAKGWRNVHFFRTPQQ